jgi:methionine synthase II (cobalamin-independent)
MPKIAPRIPRADVVGSLLRPQYLLDARNAWREGRLSETEMHKAEDRAVAEARISEAARYVPLARWPDALHRRFAT